MLSRVISTCLERRWCSAQLFLDIYLWNSRTRGQGIFHVMLLFSTDFKLNLSPNFRFVQSFLSALLLITLDE